MAELGITRIDLTWTLVDRQPYLGDLMILHGRLADGTPITHEVLVKGGDYQASYTWLNRVGREFAAKQTGGAEGVA